jgi:hypothetical protein
MERFLDPYFYVSKQKLVKDLTFEVVVWCSRPQDEENRLRIAETKVRWAERRPSPRDLANMALQGGRYDDTILTFLTDRAGTTASERLAEWLSVPYPGLPKMEDQEIDPVTVHTVPHIFTRNEQDGFVNEEELRSETFPEYEPTPLALREICGAAQRDNKTAVQAGADSGAGARGADDTPIVKGTTDSKRNRFYIVLADGQAQMHADRPPRWEGTESVLVTLQETSDGQFVAKPSLGEDHVLTGDDDRVVTYRVSIVGHSHHELQRPDDVSGSMSAVKVKEALTAADKLERRNKPAELRLESEALEQERRSTVLRQLVATTGHIATSTAGAEARAAGGNQTPFTPPPESALDQRVHLFGTVESTTGFESTLLFLRLEYVLPLDGFVMDDDVNRQCGVVHRHELCSQTACAMRMCDENDIYFTQHHFNMPFELHGIVPITTPAAPRLVVSAWAAEGDACQSLQGYGFVTLSAIPGRVSQTVHMWKPTMHGRETLRSIFVGGSTSLVHAEDVVIPYRRRLDNLRALVEDNAPSLFQASLGGNSRAGLMSESVGTMAVNWMCSTQQRPSARHEVALRRIL